MNHWDPTAGQTLYRLYARNVQRAAQGNNVISVTQSQGTPGPENPPVEWHALPPRAKAFWQELAQQFIDGLPEPRQRGYSPTGRFYP